MALAAASAPAIALGFLTASLISANWAIYVWAIGSGRTIDNPAGFGEYA